MRQTEPKVTEEGCPARILGLRLLRFAVSVLVPEQRPTIRVAMAKLVPELPQMVLHQGGEIGNIGRFGAP